MTDNKKRRSTLGTILLNILIELLLMGAVLCVFAFFHHILPRIQAKNTTVTPIAVISRPETAVSGSGAADNAPQENADMPQADDVSADPSAETEAPESEPEADPYAGMTEWQIKFHDHFTDEVVVTENSYTSPNVSITLEKVTTDEEDPVTYYLADIYIASIDNFQTYLASGTFKRYASEDPADMAKHTNALITINGDYCDNYGSGFVVRNGVVYYDQQTTMDLCVMYYDGTVKTYAPDEYLVEDILAENPYQVWYFGPSLLDENGKAKPDDESYNTGDWVWCENPRSAFGYYEPGHYCFVLVDGRQEGYSRGLEIHELARLFEDLGCTAAYNMDGGASAVMTFRGEVANQPCFAARDSGDILLICETQEFLESQETGDAPE